MIAFALAFAYATKARTTELVSPWEMELIEPYGDCAQLCGNWTALYLSDTYCKGVDMVTRDTLRFCPDKEEVEAWTFDDEQMYEAMYYRADELLMPELKIFERMTLERTMKLSVHPWQKFQLKEVQALVERRRKQGSATGNKCAGQALGLKRDKSQYMRAERPEKVAVEFQEVDGETVISYFEMRYPTGRMRGGTKDLATASKKKLPECTTIVFLKIGNDYINAIKFLSHGKESKFLGDDINYSVIIVAPQGKCLGDMKMRSEEFVHRICFKFNVDE